MLSTAAPQPQGRLEFTVEPAPAGPATPAARRRLAMQTSSTPAGQLSADGLSPAGPAADSCGVPAAPTLRLRLPVGQQLSSVIFKDGLNRTVHQESSASLAAASSAAAASGASHWTTAAVALPALHPFTEASSDQAPGCSSGDAACQAAQRWWSALLLAPDGRHSRADISAAPATLAGQQLSVRYKHYEQQRLTYREDSLTVPLSWPSMESSGAAGAGVPAGVALYDSGRDGQPLPLAHSTAAVVAGGSLPSSACSRQWSLSLQLSLSAAAATAAAQSKVGAAGCFRGPVLAVRLTCVNNFRCMRSPLMCCLPALPLPSPCPLAGGPHHPVH